MSTFNALNLTPHDEQLEAEEHSRELQIEESFKIFQGALFDLKAKRYEDANIKFDELFSMDVLKPDKWGFYKYSSPTLDSLRYLAYRNRGMYYYSYLLEHSSQMDPQDVVDNILKVMENLVESIQHSEADSSVTELLIQIFQSYKSKKLERLTLEYELTKEDNHLVLLGRKRKGLLPKLKEIIGQYESLLEDIREKDLVNSLILETFSKSLNGQSITRPALSPILSNIKKMKTIDERTMKELDVFQVPLQECSWEAICLSLKELVPHIKTSVLLTKSIDPYYEAEFPIEAVKFVTAESESNTLDTEENKEREDETTKKVSRRPSATDVSLPVVKNGETKTGAQSEEASSKKRSSDDSEAEKFVQRSSKRFRERDHDNNEEDALQVQQDFLANFSALLNDSNYEIPFKSEDFSLEMSYPDNKSLLSQYDLLECLKSWNSWHTDIYMQNDAKFGIRTTKSSANTGFMQVNLLLKSNVFGDETNAVSGLSILSNEMAEPFIKKINDHAMHFQEVRLRLLLSLLSPDDSGVRLIADCSWSSKLYDTIEWFLLGVERNLYQLIAHNLTKYSYLALSVYEILVNMMGSISEEISAKKLQGHKTNDLNNQRNQLEKRIEKWYDLLQLHHSEDEVWSIYVEWAHYCFFQYYCEIIDDRLVSALDSIENKLNELAKPLNAIYPNYRHIPPLNLAGIHSQIRKIKVIRKISVVEVSGDGQTSEDAEQHIDLLQQVLFLDLYPEVERSADTIEMLSFISSSPFLLKVKLWEVLFSFYVNNNDMENITKNYFHVLTFFDKFLSSEQYIDQSSKARQQLLLTIQSSIESFTSKFVAVLLHDGWHQSKSISRRSFQLLIEAFFLFYPMLYFESSSKADVSAKSFFRKATKSSAKMKNSITNLATLIIYFLGTGALSVSPSPKGLPTADLIECFHSLLGHFGFCDASGGNFLKLAEKLLCRSVDSDTLAQLKQILWCRYHYLIAGDNFQPIQHVTKEVIMDKENSLPLGIYLIKLQYQGRNPLLASGSKTALKPVLDNIIDTVGNPMSSGSHIVERNKFLLKEYLDTAITAKLFRSALMGKYVLAFTTPNDELQQSMDAGLFYVAGIQAFNLYRIRKKAMQARPSELDSIISMLKNDIVYNTKRFESWYLLGKCYSFIVEDDLMWTSDKLSVAEKRSAIASTQRNAILCYIMSLKLFYAKKLQTSEEETILSKALEALGSELISGYLKPMQGLCFNWRRSQTVLKLKENGELLHDKQADAVLISRFNIEQAILLCFHRANLLREKNLSIDKKNWMNYYHIGKLLFKTDGVNYRLQAYQNILEACLIALEISPAKDQILEPHYYLVNMCFKSVKAGITEPGSALALISRDNGFFKQDPSFWATDEALTVDYQKKVFYDKVIRLMTFIIASDKKKWHHRPKYRIARILFDEFDSTEGALNEMGTVMSIRSAHKNLVNIWKPDTERAGKHFVYTYQYVVFYLDMLNRKGDFNSIGLVCKKIRRFGSGMAYVNKAFEHATTLYTQCARVKLQVEEKTYVENLLPSLNYQAFLRTSEHLLKTFNEEDYTEELLQGLKIAYQLKKGNNGIVFDGICLSIYFKYFYLPMSLSPGSEMELDHEPEPKGLAIVSTASRTVSPAPSSQKLQLPRKRVSKKDAFDKIRVLVDKIT